MYYEILRKIFWNICLVLVLGLLVWGLNYLTDRIDYKWYWNRVPQYFLFTEDVDRYASENGVVHVKEVDSKKSEVVLEYANGTTESHVVRTDSLTVADGDTVTEVDKIGAISVTTWGILLKGLMVTIQLSIYAGFFGLLIGLFAGLGRISKNPLAKGLSTIYVELIRGTPLLVQLFIFYFFLGTILGFGRFSAG
ncbi:ABC transporter permease subunit, partial [bacterium]|nr:ABC transporter permease subunit [bacterium]